MRLVCLASALRFRFQSWGSSRVHHGSIAAIDYILSRWNSGHVHATTPPVFDSKVGFTDYEKERREFRIRVPEYFNFANVLDEWAQKEKVWTKVTEFLKIPSYCSLIRLGWSSNLSMNVKVKVQLIWLISGTRGVNVSASVTICFKLPIFFHESIQGWKSMARVKFLVARFDGKLSYSFLRQA